MRQFRQWLRTVTVGIGLIVLMVSTYTLAEDKRPLQGEALFSQLVTTTIEYDTYNNRCRGVSASQNESNVNRLFLRKYGVTLNNYVKTYLQSNVRAFKSDLKNQVYRKIVELGGCRQADKKGYEKSLKKSFRALYNAVEQSPWYPEVKIR